MDRLDVEGLLDLCVGCNIEVKQYHSWQKKDEEVVYCDSVISATIGCNVMTHAEGFSWRVTRIASSSARPRVFWWVDEKEKQF